jgi:hypothetical protein
MRGVFTKGGTSVLFIDILTARSLTDKAEWCDAEKPTAGKPSVLSGGVACRCFPLVKAHESEARHIRASNEATER